MVKAAQVYAEYATRPRQAGQDPLLASFLEEYKQHIKATKAKKTAANEISILDRFFSAVVTNWQTTKLNDITTPLIANYLILKKKKDGIGDKTWYNIRQALHTLFNYAIRTHGFPNNPAHAVFRPKPVDFPIVYLKLQHIKEVLEAVRNEAADILAAVAIAILAGLRRSEIVWLTWADIDIERKRLHIRPRKHESEIYIPKTRKPRMVPISDDLLPYLSTLPCGADTEWVFKTPQDCRWDEDNLSKRLATVMKKQKWTWGFNVFRHTFGSQLAQKGLSLYKIATLMGNSEAVCRRHYAALAVEDLQPDIGFMKTGCQHR